MLAETCIGLPLAILLAETTFHLDISGPAQDAHNELVTLSLHVFLRDQTHHNLLTNPMLSSFSRGQNPPRLLLSEFEALARSRRFAVAFVPVGTTLPPRVSLPETETLARDHLDNIFLDRCCTCFVRAKQRPLSLSKCQALALSHMFDGQLLLVPGGSTSPPPARRPRFIP